MKDVLKTKLVLLVFSVLTVLDITARSGVPLLVLGCHRCPDCSECHSLLLLNVQNLWQSPSPFKQFLRPPQTFP